MFEQIQISPEFFLSFVFHRDSIGDSLVADDLRWGGTFGVNVDFVARSHTSVAFIKQENIQVCQIPAEIRLLR
jgi:hypothetical protein